MRFADAKGRMLQLFCDAAGDLVPGPDLTIPLCCVASVRADHKWYDVPDVVTFTSHELYQFLCSATLESTDSEPDTLPAGNVLWPKSDTPSEDSWYSGKDDAESIPASETEFIEPGKKRRASADLVAIDRSHLRRRRAGSE